MKIDAVNAGLNPYTAKYVTGIYNRLQEIGDKKRLNETAYKDTQNLYDSAENSRTVSKNEENFSPIRLNSMRDQALQSALFKHGYTTTQVNNMQMSEKVNLRNTVVSEAQNSVRNAVRTDLIESGKTTFLRGEQLSSEVVATLLFSI